MDREIDLGVPASRLDYLVDGEATESVTPFAGEDIPTLGLLLTSEPFRTAGFISLQIVDAVDAAL